MSITVSSELSVINRPVLRCARCRLNQFKTVNGNCRRCRRPYFVPRAGTSS
jgi:hypothetical protein